MRGPSDGAIEVSVSRPSQGRAAGSDQPAVTAFIEHLP